MACKKRRGNWRSEDFQKAIEDVRDGKLSTRVASAKYNVPRSTIHDHTSQKVKKYLHHVFTCINETEVQELVQWAIKWLK